MKIFFTILAILLAPLTSKAMQCMPEPDEVTIEKTEAIFMGEIIEREGFNRFKNEDGFCVRYSEEKPTCGDKIAKVRISKTWKGGLKAGDEVTVYSDDACYCVGEYFALNKTYVIFANKITGGDLLGKADYGAIYCKGSHLVEKDYAKEIIDKLDNYSEAK